MPTLIPDIGSVPRRSFLGSKRLGLQKLPLVSSMRRLLAGQRLHMHRRYSQHAALCNAARITCGPLLLICAARPPSLPVVLNTDPPAIPSFTQGAVRPLAIMSRLNAHALKASSFSVKQQGWHRLWCDLTSRITLPRLINEATLVSFT